MIIKNEELTLADCLDSAKSIADEIIIIDTGSDDKSVDIARAYTSNVFNFMWADDFSAARNFSFSKATMDYILWLDADDIILEKDLIKLKELKYNLDPAIDAVIMKYNIGSDESGNPVISFNRERLLKRSRNFVWNDPVHEYIDLCGRIYNSDISITHRKLKPKTDRNLLIFERMLSEGKKPTDRNLFYFARELFTSSRFEEAMKYYEMFLATESQPVSNYIISCIDMAKYYAAANDKKNSLISLLRSFEYDTPHAEICCMLGCYYKELFDYEHAILWYELATRLKKPGSNTDYSAHDCYDFYPYIELCYCYNNSGNIKQAIKYNEKALELKPNNPLALQNKAYFMEMYGDIV